MSDALSHLSSPKYRPDIDGLRALAVLSVVLFHAFPGSLKGGFTGVDIFFVISGYLISTILFENLKRGTFSFCEFYARRIKRIFPALFVVLTGCLVFGWFALLADEYKQLGKHVAAGAGFISNFMFWQEAGYFDNASETKPLLHLWSLGIEEQFYILWPLLLWLGSKLRRNLIVISLLLACLSFILNAIEVYRDPVGTFYAPQSRFWELLCGGALAWGVLNRRWLRIKGRWADVGSLIGAGLLIGSFVGIRKDNAFPGYWAMMPVLGALLVIASGPKAWFNANVLSKKIFVWFGLISFPLYLWHWPLLSFARIVESQTPGIAVRVCAVVLAVLLAWLTYCFVERPIRFGSSSRLKVPALLVAMLISGSAGYMVFDAEGFDNRLFVRDFKNNTNELVRTPAVNDECLAYIGTPKPLFVYCRYTNVGAKETVAVVGDSHAHVAYPGIAEYNKSHNVNTVLLANSSCPLLVGFPTGKNIAEKQECDQRLKQIMTILVSRKDIKKVFIFGRGSVYVTGQSLATEDASTPVGYGVTYDDFFKGSQNTIDKLAAQGKKVYFVTENPELSMPIEACIARPLRVWVKDCRPERSRVLSRQAAYLDRANKLAHASIVNSLDAFCPQEKCKVFDDGTLLYADDNHLSVAGSVFQATNLLGPYLE